MINFFKRLAHNQFLGYVIFYGWNVLFFFTALTLEITERVFSDLVYAVFTSYTPFSYFVYTLVIFVIPIISVIIGVRRHGEPSKLLRLFYGFEVPVIFLAMFRIFGFQELTFSIGLWLGLMLLATLGYGVQLLYRNKLPAAVNQSLALIQMVIGLLQAVFIALYAVPLLWLMLSSLPEIRLEELLELGILGFVVGLFLVVTGSLFVVSPLAFIGFYFIGNLQRFAAWVRQRRLSWPGVAAGVLILTFAFYYPSQPQHASFSLYAEWSEGQLAGAELLEQEQALKEGLLNAYLWRYRYLSPAETKYSPIKELYDDAFGIEEPWVGKLHNWILSPFLYQGERSDQNKAALAYEHVFDQAMERAEREEIIEAMSANHRPRQVEAGILSINQKQVKVTNRDLQSREVEPGVVELEFHERYVNQTYREQEVFYYFTLPAHCVITGLWLSDTDENLRKYPYQIAPRGAAQKTYQQIRARRADPALLEQVGPYQYRLRVFPIPARVYYYRRADGIRREEEAPSPMHITLRLLSLSNGETVPVPELTEKRNVYWETGLAGCDKNQWFPEIKESYSAYSENTAHKGLLRVAREKIPHQPSDEEFLVLLDGSYSMRNQREAFEKFWDKFPYRNQSRLFVLNGSKMEELKEANWPHTLVGTNDALLALKILSRKYPQKRIIWVTDKGNYELLGNDTVRQRFVPPMPVDVVHLNGYAPIYEDAFAESIMASGGSFYASGSEWLNWAGREYHPELLQWREADELLVFKDSLNFSRLGETAPLWASRYTMAKNRDIKQGQQVAALDSLHHLAMKYSFVSPFSSFICLVNDRQQELLKENMSSDDRFDRAVENGKMAGAEGILNAHAVPEPHEWVLIIFGAGLLLVLYRRRLARKLLSS